MFDFIGGAFFGFFCAFASGSVSSYEYLKDKYIRGLNREFDVSVPWAILLWVLTLYLLIKEPSPSAFGMVFGILLIHYMAYR